MQLYEVHGGRRIHGQLVGRVHTLRADNPEQAAARYLALYPDQGAEVSFAVRLPGVHARGLTMSDVEKGFAVLVHCPECGQMELWTPDETQDHGLCRSSYLPCPICEVAHEPND